MATVTFTIPDTIAPQVIQAFQRAYPGDWATAQAAGRTGAQFLQQEIAAYVKNVYLTDVTTQQTQAAMTNPTVTSAQTNATGIA